MRRINKRLIISIAVLIVIGGALIAWGRYNAATAPLAMWKDTDVACLEGGHQSAVRHIHAQLLITENGTQQTIPANVGIEPGCMAEVHTHEPNGRLHVETARAGRADKITLADFFAVWGRPFDREDMAETIVVNGQRELSDPSEVQITEGKQIHLRYTSATGTDATSSEVMTAPTDRPADHSHDNSPHEAGDGHHQ